MTVSLLPDSERSTDRHVGFYSWREEDERTPSGPRRRCGELGGFCDLLAGSGARRVRRGLNCNRKVARLAATWVLPWGAVMLARRQTSPWCRTRRARLRRRAHTHT